MNIRPYQPGDAACLEDIFRRAVEIIGAEHYSASQVAAWAGPRVTAAGLHSLYSDGRATFIAVRSRNIPVAFSDLEADGHIDMLYCDPVHARQGIASALLAVIEAEARVAGIERLYTEASEAARPVFVKAGFETRRRRELDVDGVALHNWAMDKSLSGAKA